MRRSGDYVDSGEGWARPAGRGKAFVWLIRRRTELTRCKMRRSGDYVDSGEGWARPAGRGKAFVWLIRAFE